MPPKTGTLLTHVGISRAGQAGVNVKHTLKVSYVTVSGLGHTKHFSVKLADTVFSAVILVFRVFFSFVKHSSTLILHSTFEIHVS